MQVEKEHYWHQKVQVQETVIKITKVLHHLPMHRLTQPDMEAELESALQDIGDEVAALHKKMSPHSFKNMTRFEDVAKDCRIGSIAGQRPYSGITTVVDFCAHSHWDTLSLIHI